MTPASPGRRVTTGGICESCFHGPDSTEFAKRRASSGREDCAFLFLSKATLDRFQPVAHFLDEVFQLLQTLRDFLLLALPAFLSFAFPPAPPFPIFFFLQPPD